MKTRTLLLTVATLMVVTAAQAGNYNYLEAPADAYNAAVGACPTFRQSQTIAAGPGQVVCLKKALAGADQELNAIY